MPTDGCPPQIFLNTLSSLSVFPLVSRPGFCDKSDSSELICVRTCSLFFHFSVLKSSSRERGVVL